MLMEGKCVSLMVYVMVCVHVCKRCCVMRVSRVHACCDGMWLWLLHSNQQLSDHEARQTGISIPCGPLTREHVDQAGQLVVVCLLQQLLEGDVAFRNNNEPVPQVVQNGTKMLS